MGAQQFFVEVRTRENLAQPSGANRLAMAQSAFQHAVKEAAWDHGHSGYTGTIAEKDSFEMVRVPAGVAPKDFARWIQNGGEEARIKVEVTKDDRYTMAAHVGDTTRYYRFEAAPPLAPEHKAAVEAAERQTDDKWGPAGCIDLLDGGFIFFGWASS